MIVGGSAVVSMGGIFFNDLTGLPNLFGAIPVAAINIVPVLWRDKLVRASSMLISVIMIVGMILLSLFAVLHRSEQTVKIVSTFYLPEGVSLWTGVSGAIALGLSNACNAPTYSISKAAATMMTQCRAMAWAQYGVYVNGIAPGQIMLGMGENSTPEHIARMSAKVPQRRLGTVDDLNSALIFLASDACRYTQGQIILCDDGLLLPLA